MSRLVGWGRRSRNSECLYFGSFEQLQSVVPSNLLRLSAECLFYLSLKKTLPGKGNTARSSFKTFSGDTRNGVADNSDLRDASGSFQLDELTDPSDKSRLDLHISPDFGPGKPDLQKTGNKDWDMLASEHWSARRGHGLTYAGLFIFTFVLYFRPYELIASLSGMTSIALIVALGTLLIYLPSQMTADGSLTATPVEVKCVLFLTLWALITIPFAKNPNFAWEEFNEHFSKVAIIFVVMVNVLRTIPRLKGLMWLGIAVGVVLSYQAVSLYREGVFAVEGYRVRVDFGGMFGNPNDMAIHLLMFIPISIGLGLVSRRTIGKIAYFSFAFLMTAAVLVTQSRGAFLGLLAVAGVLIWKLGKANRLNMLLVSTAAGIVVALVAPGNYMVRIMSIFIPSLDPVSSTDARWGLFTRSLLVTLRNPLGIGIGNFTIVGQHNQESHNAYTQVSAELGWLALAAYVIFLISPLRKLGALERITDADRRERWINTMSKVLYASIIGYMVASLFGSVAYNWFIYYPVAFAVCLRRLYQSDVTKDALVTGT